MARIVSFVCALVFGGVLMPPVFADDLKVGDRAPDFKLVGTDGKTYSLSDLKGKTIVLAWFPKAFTGG